jgi:2-keto-3-deoxy-L-rhamnonate aldolase RhmA
MVRHRQIRHLQARRVGGPAVTGRIGVEQPALGTFVNLGSPLVTEICAMAGFDWLLVDLEHGAGGEEALVGQVLAAAAHDVPLFVRVESLERIRVGRVLDLGVAGVMIPRIAGASDAMRVARWARYPPQGDRGVATYNRSCSFGARPEALLTANDEVTVILQIETRGALADVEEIAATPGVDALFVGPRDLSHALGVPGAFDAPEYLEALERVVGAASDQGIAAGILAKDQEAAGRYASAGFGLVAVGSDSSFLMDGARQAAAAQVGDGR